MIKISEAPQVMLTVSDIDHLAEAISDHVNDLLLNAYRMGRNSSGIMSPASRMGLGFDAKAVLHNLLGVE